jgi:predicted transcriptional regulator of viral defense system
MNYLTVRSRFAT